MLGLVETMARERELYIKVGETENNNVEISARKVKCTARCDTSQIRGVGDVLGFG